LSYLEYLKETVSAFSEMKRCSQEIEVALQKLEETVHSKGTILLCGNGGSAGDAQHWAAELVGIFRGPGKPIRAISLTTDTSVISSIANDVSWNEVYSRQLLALGSVGDVLIAISTSGNSENVVEAIKMAKKIGIFSILVTGGDGGKMIDFADLSIVAPSTKTEVIQHIHLTVGHYLTGALADRFR